jgi:hypothetical protein
VGYYAMNNEQGWAVFYHTDVHETIPDGAIPVSDDDFNKAMNEYDAGQRRLIVVQNGQLVFNPIPQPTPEELLEQAKQSKIWELSVAYDQALARGFTSSATGTPTVYGWKDTDQLHLEQVQEAIDKGIDQFPVEYADVNGNVVVIPDQETLTKLELDAKTFSWNMVKQNRKLIGQVRAAQSIDEVNAIQWTPPA